MKIRTIERRANLLALSGNESARYCAADALACLRAHFAGDPHPAPPCRRPGCHCDRTWIGAAAKWIDRGAQHAYGFRRPQGW